MDKTMPANDGAVIDSWRANARDWVSAVDKGVIVSRRRATNAAIVEAVMACRPRRVMDLGCGEGWLARELAERGVAVHGFDAVEALVEQARQRGGGFFYPFSFSDFAAGRIHVTADVLVCNFSLLDEHSVAAMLPALPERLEPGGCLIIQTLHPVQLPDAEPGSWQIENWQAVSHAFAAPAPWFFRSPGQWQQLLEESGFSRVVLEQVKDPDTGEVLSLLISAHPS